MVFIGKRSLFNELFGDLGFAFGEYECSIHQRANEETSTLLLAGRAVTTCLPLMSKIRMRPPLNDSPLMIFSFC